MRKDSSQNSWCHFKCNASHSELIALPIKAVLPSGRMLQPKVYLCACRQAESRTFDLDMSGVICFGSNTIETNLSSCCSRREVGFVTHCVQFLNAVCQCQGWERKPEKFPKATEYFLIRRCVFRPNLAGKQQMIHSPSLPSWCFYDVLQTQRINTFNERCKSIALKSKDVVCIAFCLLLEKMQFIRVCLASWWFHLDGIKPLIPPRPERLHRSEYLTEDD